MSEPVVRAQSLDDVVEVVPYLLGFSPQQSLVVLVVENNRVQLTARADLADLAPEGNAEQLMDRIWNRYPDATAFLLAYTDQDRTGWDMLRRCGNRVGMEKVRNEVLVDGAIWRAASGERGTVNPHGVIAATVTVAGLQTRESREAVAADFASPPATEALYSLLDQTVLQLPAAHDDAACTQAIATLMRSNLDQPQMSPTDAFRLAALAHHEDARDTAMLAITVDNATQHLQMWRNVISQVPAAAAAGSLFLAGMAAWVTGDGARASMALERLETGAPERDAARLLDQMGAARLLTGVIANVVPPSQWEEIRAAVLQASKPTVQAAVSATTTGTGPVPVWEDVQAPERPTNRPEPPALGNPPDTTPTI